MGRSPVRSALSACCRVVEVAADYAVDAPAVPRLIPAAAEEPAH
jgi:hypothetical protein